MDWKSRKISYDLLKLRRIVYVSFKYNAAEVFAKNEKIRSELNTQLVIAESRYFVTDVQTCRQSFNCL